VFKPYIDKLNEIGVAGFNSILLRDPTRERTAGLMLDIAQTILQNAEGYQERATDAFQEVVSDLYDGFLSAADRRGVDPPEGGIVPPLVKWGNPDFGPYTWPVDATDSFNVKAGVVSLPPANGRRDILAWAALGHETAGHDILGADDGLRDELSNHVFSALDKEALPQGLAEYWASRIDETASDVMGILNMGPAAAIGLIGYFRGLNAAFGGNPTLRDEGSASDPHPADVLRGYLAASVVRLLSFKGAKAWAEMLEKETDKDVIQIQLEGVPINTDIVRRSAAIVANTLVRTRAQALEGHALGYIQNWRNRDEEIVRSLRVTLNTTSDVSAQLKDGFYAAHVVAAAVMCAISTQSPLPMLFERMITLLKAMHDQNPSWGPLFVRHPGDMVMHRSYVRAHMSEEVGEISV
jgi:hypothetical protein